MDNHKKPKLAPNIIDEIVLGGKKIKKQINWKPEISFETGVNEMLMNIKNWKNAPLWNKKKIKVATKNWFKYLS